jgi:hypothetical protein
MSVISVQVLGEFFHATVTRKKLLAVDKARVALTALRHLEVVSLDEAMVERAIDFHEPFQLRYWDALIVATAKLSGCVSVKPGSNGQRIEHFRCLKPAFGLPGDATIDVSRANEDEQDNLGNLPEFATDRCGLWISNSRNG